MATIRDVAKKAGVSIATVSRVINNKGKIKQETEAAVRAAIEELDYTPNKVAQGLSNQRSHAIAFILPSINNPFFPQMARAIEDVAQRNGYHVFICNTDDDREKLLNYLENLAIHYVDGIILSSHILKEIDIERLRKNNVSIVMTDRVMEQEQVTTFSIKNRKGSRMATQHLLDVGCKRVAHISGLLDTPPGRDRMWGYLDIAESQSWYAPSYISRSDFTVEGGYHAAKELFMRHQEIDGIFAGNDLMAIGVLRAAHEWGKAVPNELAIVGFDGIDMSALTTPPITTIQQPIYELGEMAMEQLLALMDDKNHPVQARKLDVELVIRETTMRTSKNNVEES